MAWRFRVCGRAQPETPLVTTQGDERMRKLITMLALTLGALALTATAFGHDGTARPPRRQEASHKHGHFPSAPSRSRRPTTARAGPSGRPTSSSGRYVVKKNGDGSYTLTRFDRGRFTTLAGVSPGACDTTGDHGHDGPGRRQGPPRRLHPRHGHGRHVRQERDVHRRPTAASRDVFLKTFFGPNAQSGRAT